MIRDKIVFSINDTGLYEQLLSISDLTFELNTGAETNVLPKKIIDQLQIIVAMQKNIHSACILWWCPHQTRRCS